MSDQISREALLPITLELFKIVQRGVMDRLLQNQNLTAEQLCISEGKCFASLFCAVERELKASDE